MKITFLTTPSTGGVFSVFRELRQQLERRGAVVHSLAPNPSANPVAQAERLLREIEQTAPDVLVCNVFRVSWSRICCSICRNRYAA